MKHSRTLLATALWAVCFFAGLGLSLPGRETRLTFLSVGQGDCTVFRHAGTTVLIDVGPGGGEIDAGERVVIPALRRAGVQSVDLVLISHPDDDHAGGLDAVLRHYNVAGIAMPSHFRNHPAVKDAMARNRIGESKTIWIKGPKVVRLGDFEMRIDSPDLPAGEPDNDGSLFVKIVGRGGSCVFSGDASAQTESIMASQGDWTAQILKTGHHGGSQSTGRGWLREVNPRFAVLSAGRNNRYGHPSPEVLDRLATRRVRALRTDLTGDIEFRLGASGFQPMR